MKCGFVALVGRPNAGKSTLLNRLVGQKLAIVSDKPQTTRHRIVGVRNVPAGQIVFIDTPGIHKPMHRMNQRMVDAATATLKEVDVAVLVVDATEPPGGGDRFVLDLVTRSGVKAILALNKIDRLRKPALLPIIQRYMGIAQFAAVVPVSAVTGDGADILEREIVAALPEGEPLYPDDYLTDQSARSLAAEMVREQVLALTRAELPFTTAVVVDRYEEPEDDEEGPLAIYCSILVEEPSHEIPVRTGHARDLRMTPRVVVAK